MKRAATLLLALPLAFGAASGCSSSSDGSGGSSGSGDISVHPGALPDGRVELAYQASLQVDGAAASASWSVGGGALPPGIVLGADGTLCGAPTRSGDYAFSVTVDDGSDQAAGDFSIHVPPVALLSGFGPFQGYPVNPSIEALKPLDLQIIAGLDVRVIEIPVEWDVSWTELEAKIDELGPIIAIGTGVASTDAMRYETTAQNQEDGVDVANVDRKKAPIVDGGPASLPSELPLSALSDAVSAAGYKTKTSQSAGTFLCNYIFYHLANRANGDNALLAGFIHVPPAPTNSFQIADITAAHQVELETLASLLLGH